jgi:NADPH:quinone reductase-like Zn-dependent oxidoreductase
VFPSAGLVKVPHYLTDEEASTLPVAAVTAWMALNTFQPLGFPLNGREKIVLIQGTGGVSVSALQITHALQLTSMETLTNTFGTLLMVISHCNIFIRRKVKNGTTARCNSYN